MNELKIKARDLQRGDRLNWRGHEDAIVLDVTRPYDGVSVKLQLENDVTTIWELHHNDCVYIKCHTQSRTTAELDDLKCQWRNDPIFVLERTEGFEYHYEELKAYRLLYQEDQAMGLLNIAHEEQRLLAVALHLPLPEYEALVREIWAMKKEIKMLYDKIHDLETARNA